MSQLSLAEVKDVRDRIAFAHQRAAIRFRDAYARHPLPPVAHMEMFVEELLADARGIRVEGAPYKIENDLLIPNYDAFDVDRTPAAIFEYWMTISEVTGSSAWRMTRVIATAEEYDEALRRMQSPQIVRALVASFLPTVHLERSLLEVTLYTRATEERIERRAVALDANNEFHFHSRELLAEGRGGIVTS